MDTEELQGFRRMQFETRDPLVVPTFLVAVAAMTSFVVGDVARESEWGAGANLRVAGTVAALILLGLLR